MPDEIRQLTPADKPANLRLMSQAFERGRVIKEETWDETFGTETIGVFDGNTLRASVTVRPFIIHWKNAVSGTLSMGGVAGVATQNEARGRGYIGRLLRESLVQMRGAGMVVSALYPFAWAFYRRFGWEWAGERRTITLPLCEIKATDEGRFVREIPDDTAQELLAPVYDRYAAKYHGAFVSASHLWKDKLKHNDDRTTFVYGYFPDGGDVPEAYLLWRYDAEGEGGRVGEFVADTPNGYRALFGLLHYLGTQCRTARMEAPADAPVWHHLMHWGTETRTAPVFQVRVVDVCAAMAQLSVPGGLGEDATATITISDNAAPWNDGTFRVSVESGAVQCAPAPDIETADVTMDIQAFSQAFWGDPALPALRGAGRLTVSSERGFDTLAALLPATPVWTLDDF